MKARTDRLCLAISIANFGTVLDSLRDYHHVVDQELSAASRRFVALYILQPFTLQCNGNMRFETWLTEAEGTSYPSFGP